MNFVKVTIPELLLEFLATVRGVGTVFSLIAHPPAAAGELGCDPCLKLPLREKRAFPDLDRTRQGVLLKESVACAPAYSERCDGFLQAEQAVMPGFPPCEVCQFGILHS